MSRLYFHMRVLYHFHWIGLFFIVEKKSHYDENYKTGEMSISNEGYQISYFRIFGYKNIS